MREAEVLIALQLKQPVPTRHKTLTKRHIICFTPHSNQKSNQAWIRKTLCRPCYDSIEVGCPSIKEKAIKD